MAKYDGLIIPRSWNEYINKSDGATLSQAMQLPGAMDAVPTPGSTKPAQSGGIYTAINDLTLVVTSDDRVLTGTPLVQERTLKIFFTTAQTSGDDTTCMTITYNGTVYPVKACKDGSLVDFVAHSNGSDLLYLQAYTTLELAFDGSQFVVMGNPVVISNDDFSIMADGSITYKNVYKQYLLTSSVSGDVINIENIKSLVLANIENYNSGTSIINFDSQKQRGTLILSKTSNELFSFFYITGYLSYTIYRQYLNGWNE